jgi:predicted small secreted protein
MPRLRLVLLVLLAALSLGACHTIEGMGKDIKSAGGAIENAAD